MPGRLAALLLSLVACGGRTPPEPMPTDAATQPTWRVFYDIQSTGQSLAGDDATPVEDLAQVQRLIEAMEPPRDFVGLVDAQGGTLQVAWHEDPPHYWVEIPEVERRGSHVKVMTREQTVHLFTHPPARFTTETVPGLTFQAW